MNWRKRYLVEPGSKVRLKRFDPADTAGMEDKAEARKLLTACTTEIETLQERLYAEHRRAVLLILQGMDASGKDGTVKHVMSGVNPQGCTVTSFKQPTALEQEHDFLWRVHQAVPPFGKIGIFNRSHYEDVLIVRVHSLVPKATWSERYDQINAFEEILARNGVHILKFFLHMSKDEQLRRLEARLADPEKLWKYSAGDLVERKSWDEYMQAYEDLLSRCSTKRAPWFIIPSDQKWFRNLAVSNIVAAEMKGMKIKFPEPSGSPAASTESPQSL